MNINIGCGQSPTKGFINYDKSLSVRLSKFPLIFIKILYKLKIIAQQHFEYINFLKKNNILYCDARVKIPLEDSSVSNVYSSHCLEHLSFKDADKFLSECYRVLKPNGGIRLVVPNLRLIIEDYNDKKNADAFFNSLEVFQDDHIKDFGNIQFFIRKILNDGISHKHMYDEDSLINKLTFNKFRNPKVVSSKETTLNNIGELNLSERSDNISQSLYVEAFK